VSYKVMTADRVVRVITRTNAPIIGPIRTECAANFPGASLAG